MNKLDILNRGEFVEQLLNLIKNISGSNSSACFAINGAWGSGKSFVLDILQEELEKIQSESTMMETMSAYDIQKLVEYRNISKWVKISTPSIYKKAVQLEKKGLIKGEVIKEGKMPEKSVYSLTEAGEKEFERLMFEISSKPIHIFLDFNAVIVNLDSLPLEKQRVCLTDIERNIQTLKAYLNENLLSKENMPGIPETGMAVLRQQLVLAEAIETWLESLKR